MKDAGTEGSREGKHAWARPVIIVLLVAVVAMHVIGFTFLSLTWQAPSGQALTVPLSTTGFLISSLSFSIVGAIIAWSRPSNLIGWLCLAVAIMSFEVPIGRYLAYTLLIDPGTSLPKLQVAGALLANSWILGANNFLILMIVFPRGRPSSRTMRWAAWALPALAVAVVLVGFVRPGPLTEPFGQYENEAAIEGFTASNDVAAVLTVMFALIGVVVAVDMVRRFLRSTGEERLQFKWFACATALIPGLMVVWLAISVMDAGAVRVLDLFFPLVLTSVAVAIGIAVLRHRLYDIDLLINRTLVYGSLTSILAALYGGLVVFLQAVLSPLSGSSNLSIALTTLVVAALFFPARQRVQMAVNRRFNRRAYDAARTIDAFSVRLRDRSDLRAMQEELLAVVEETMQPSSVQLWLRVPDRWRDG